MRNVGYFTSWSIYDRKYLPSQIPANVLTHVLYAFANIRPDSGQVYLTDAWADEQIHHDGEPWDDYGRPLLYGNFKALLKLKQEHRHLKVLLSIGGWTHSSNFAQAAATQAGRDTFATSSVKLLEEYALDGLDVDWEFPKNDGEAQDYVDLLRTCRLALDAHARRKGESVPYELTVAAPCGAAQSQQLRIRQMDQYLSFWNLMSYDYSGPWGDKADHQANVLATSTNNGICTDRAVQYYLSQAVRPDKLVIGIPLYGRSFLNCKGPGHSYSGQGQGSWEIGTYDYKALVRRALSASFAAAEDVRPAAIARSASAPR
ncbi:glycoside hydrolase family 18 protein [Mixia osmundae IAM 14324]|uniref:glycoside hydrolase family 18 protein n=1 Tax=Mixia osmundae (strain CBS 9802 / IAM 14324 / JCM 22182 / KY 12970) TaxID=764103 RepID=UPI0004A5546F|nr:glycoside hydrolase family 18 protein [Mixia osmundae IAM 14324]KEI40318.1 glycoside hydrolase family 18 protein [Mixia osmundae IAM 14324]